MHWSRLAEKGHPAYVQVLMIERCWRNAFYLSPVCGYWWGCECRNGDLGLIRLARAFRHVQVLVFGLVGTRARLVPVGVGHSLSAWRVFCFPWALGFGARAPARPRRRLSLASRVVLSQHGCAANARARVWSGRLGRRSQATWCVDDARQIGVFLYWRRWLLSLSVPLRLLWRMGGCQCPMGPHTSFCCKAGRLSVASRGSVVGGKYDHTLLIAIGNARLVMKCYIATPACTDAQALTGVCFCVSCACSDGWSPQVVAGSTIAGGGVA